MADLLAQPNTLLLGIFGISLVLSGRWRHLRWLPVYVLTLLVCSLAYRAFLPTPEFSLLKRLVGELLALGVVVEILRKDAGKRPIWPWFALAGLTVIPFLPLHPAMRYYLPQEIFALGLALELPSALRGKNAPLIAWSLLGMATLLSDALKLIAPSRVVWQVLILMDTWLFTGFVILLLGGLFLPELRRIGNWFSEAAARDDAGYDNAAHAGATSGEPAAPPQAKVIRFENRSGAARRMRMELEELNTRLDALGAAIGMTSLTPPSLEKTFLSRRELALYLGTSPEVAERFIDNSGIEKHPLTEEPGAWVVRLEDVKDTLLRA